MTISRNGIRQLQRGLFVLVASACICALTTTRVLAAELVWSGDFEEGNSSIDGTSDADYDLKLLNPGTDSDADVRSTGGMGICGAPREGAFAGRTRILDGGSGEKVRAEIMTHMPGRFKFDWDGPEYWVGVSLCIAEWPPGSDVHTFFQIHAPNEAKTSNCDFAGNALTIDSARDTANIRVIDNPSGISEGSGANSNNKNVYSFNIRDTLGQWQDFVFRFHLSTTGNGYYTVWHNGTQVASESGLVNVNWKDSCGNVITKTAHNGLHLGMYGGPNSAGPKTIFIDSAKIAEGSGGYSVVAPNAAQASRPNPPTQFTAN